MLLYLSLPEKGSKEETIAQQQPTLCVSASKEPSRLPNVEIFKVSTLTITVVVLGGLLFRLKILVLLKQLYYYIKIILLKQL